MHLTGVGRSQFRGRPVMRSARSAPVAAFVIVAGACAAAAHPTQTAAAPAIVMMGLPASPESAMSITKRALGEIGGTLQAVQWQPNIAVLSTRYTANRRGAGMREIAVVASVARSVPDTLMPFTLVELRAWAMDSLAVRRTIDAPVGSPDTRVHRPRPITFDDVEDWESVEVVMRLLAQHGGRRLRRRSGRGHDPAVSDRRGVHRVGSDHRRDVPTLRERRGLRHAARTRAVPPS